MVGRSRTGCLTCRQRKLKCDEVTPVCGQCHKAARDCVPSGGIVFRHHQNASMNQYDGDESDSLPGFYAYKDTFGKNTTWTKVPQKLSFIVNADPYADLDPDEVDSDEVGTTSSMQESSRSHKERSPRKRERTTSDNMDVDLAHPSGLDALSAAAAQDAHSRRRPVALPARRASSQEAPMMGPRDARRAVESPLASVGSESSPNQSFKAVNLNPHVSRLYSPHAVSVGENVFDPVFGQGGSLSSQTEFENEHEVAFLLRHYAEGPGQWMDLYDLQLYFAYYVPVKALTNPLLKYAACAYTAKQLSRVKGRRIDYGGNCSQQAPSEAYPDIRKADWALKETQYYDKAISLLVAAIKEGPASVLRSQAESETASSGDRNSVDRFQDVPMSVEEMNGMQRGSPQQNPFSDQSSTSFGGRKKRKISDQRALSDEMAAATAILCNYEMLKGQSLEWDRHLDGTKSLLDIFEGRLMPLQAPTMMPRPPISRARQATFWDFARQDFLSAIINGTSTRLNTEDLPMWFDAGLKIGEDGYVKPSNTTANGLPEGDCMKEDMIGNALIWIIMKIINFSVAYDNFVSSPADINYTANHAAMIQRWGSLREELALWHSSLPDSCKPISRLASSDMPQRILDKSSVFPESWFCIPMCASTMQHYHMAYIILQLNQPPQPPCKGQFSLFRRVDRVKSTAADIESHARAICSIAVSRPPDCVRIHQLQPLYTAGQCLEGTPERMEIIRLLRQVEYDTGWATEYRVKQLLDLWKWPYDGPPDPT